MGLNQGALIGLADAKFPRHDVRFVKVRLDRAIALSIVLMAMTRSSRMGIKLSQNDVRF